MLTLESIKKYILKEYGVDFKLEYEEPNNYEKYANLVYKVGKKEYQLSVGYAYQKEEECECWSVYNDFMDYGKWYGFGNAKMDLGTATIDDIMNEWGFEKIKQLSLF